MLLDLPSLGSKVAKGKAPASYTKIVIKGMTKAEMTLKVVMSNPSDPPKEFVEQYVKLVTEPDLAEFQKVLEMKGLRKLDQTAYLEIFKTVAPSVASAAAVASDTEPTGSPVKAAIEATASSSLAPAGTATGEESRIKKLERLIKQGFDR